MALTWDELQRKLEADPAYVAAERQLRPYLDIANVILLTRLKHGWTQKQLARRAGLPLRKIDAIESALGNPRLETLQKIADALSIGLLIAPRQQ